MSRAARAAIDTEQQGLDLGTFVTESVAELTQETFGSYTENMTEVHSHPLTLLQTWETKQTFLNLLPAQTATAVIFFHTNTSLRTGRRSVFAGQNTAMHCSPRMVRGRCWAGTSLYWENGRVLTTGATHQSLHKAKSHKPDALYLRETRRQEALGGVLSTR